MTTNAALHPSDVPTADAIAGLPSRLGRIVAVGATLRAWRARARERAELAVMDGRERRDLPLARDFDIRREIAKPFWRD